MYIGVIFAYILFYNIFIYLFFTMIRLAKWVFPLVTAASSIVFNGHKRWKERKVTGKAHQDFAKDVAFSLGLGVLTRFLTPVGSLALAAAPFIVSGIQSIKDRSKSPQENELSNIDDPSKAKATDEVTGGDKDNLKEDFIKQQAHHLEKKIFKDAAEKEYSYEEGYIQYGDQFSKIIHIPKKNDKENTPPKKHAIIYAHGYSLAVAEEQIMGYNSNKRIAPLVKKIVKENTDHKKEDVETSLILIHQKGDQRTEARELLKKLKQEGYETVSIAAHSAGAVSAQYLFENILDETIETPQLQNSKGKHDFICAPVYEGLNEKLVPYLPPVLKAWSDSIQKIFLKTANKGIALLKYIQPFPKRFDIGHSVQLYYSKEDPWSRREDKATYLENIRKHFPVDCKDTSEMKKTKDADMDLWIKEAEVDQFGKAPKISILERKRHEDLKHHAFNSFLDRMDIIAKGTAYSQDDE